MRTQAEILARIVEVGDGDIFGTERGDLINALEFENAQPYLKPETTREQWDEDLTSRSDEGVRKQVVDYLDFAIGKAEDERGLSSMRSIYHFRAWLYLIGDEELSAFVGNDNNYEPYGKPMLRAIDAKYRAAAAREALGEGEVSS